MEYKVIVRDRETGEEKYIKGLNRADSEKSALTQARDAGKQVYISWADRKWPQRLPEPRRHDG